jgi:hypothetical protein
MTMKVSETGWEPSDVPIVPARCFRAGAVGRRDKAGMPCYHPCISINDEYAVMFNDFDEAEEYLKSVIMAIAEARIRLDRDLRL